MATQQLDGQEATTAKIPRAREFALQGRIDGPQNILAGIDFEPMYAQKSILITEQTNISWAHFVGDNVTLSRRNISNQVEVTTLTFSIEDLDAIVIAAKQKRIAETTFRVANVTQELERNIARLNELSPSPAKKRRR